MDILIINKEFLIKYVLEDLFQ